jgi:hypothetical protein
MAMFILGMMISVICAFAMIGIGIDSEDFKTRIFYIGLGICFVFVGALLAATK